MRFAKPLMWLFLFSFSMFTLVACGNPDPEKNPITSDMVTSGLPGKAVTGMGDTGFTFDGPMYMEDFNVSYDGKKGMAKVQLRAVNLSNKDGIDGEIQAHYEFRDKAWQLSKLTAAPEATMRPAYAQRLTELADFPLHFAANIGDQDAVAKELEDGAEVNAPEGKKRSTAVMFASERGFLPIVKLLVEKGADVTIPNMYGYTALHAGTTSGHNEVVKFLLESGADVNAVDERGRTPLFTAAEQSSLELVRMFKEKGANLDIRDNKQWTPLYAAVNGGSVEVAKFLIENGVKVKSGAPGGSRSPLLTASYSGNTEMVKLLLDAGADVTAKISMGHSPYQGMTALKIAERQGHDEVVKLLKEAGAE